MKNFNRSLFKAHSKKYDIPTLLAISAVTLILGLSLPVITFRELIFFKTTFSIVSGIFSLFHGGHYILGLLILLFSILFPILKLTTLILVWFYPIEDEKRSSYIHWLAIFGKWSMLDVFVVAIMIVIAKISKLASADPRLGIYFFAISIVLAIISTMRIEKLLKPSIEGQPKIRTLPENQSRINLN